MDGASVLAQALKDQGVDYMFGVVGIPIIEVGFAAQGASMRYIGMRNEQSASYAAGAIGYMTGRPGACLAVSGPGVVHALAGLANAWSNCWPMILIGGASDTDQDGKGAFQEAPQLEYAKPFCKYVARPDSVERIPFFVEQAVRHAISGRPGAVYLDIPGTLVTGKAKGEVVFPKRCPDPPRTLSPKSTVEAAIALLQKAERPLIIVGKGCAYARAEDEVRDLVKHSGIPFLATPMGKGVVPDDHTQSVASARSLALKRADVVVLLGARLNWMLHFGQPPRFAKGVKFIQLDICAEEMGNNAAVSVALLGDAKAVVGQLAEQVQASKWRYGEKTPWWGELRQSVARNRAVVSKMLADDSVPMSYYRVFRDVQKVLPKDAIIVSEGANTMDIGRTLMPNYFPRHRLDAGTFGTMGVGLGFAVAAAVLHPDKKVVAVEGDSAFGFSGMELETAARYKLAITFIIVNNNGIYQGLEELEGEPDYFPPTALKPRAHYEEISKAFGGLGLFVSEPDKLLPALRKAMAYDKGPSVVNVMINPFATRKPQKFDWLTRSKL